MMTPAVDDAVNKGLAWLASQQNADGSFGSGAYRGNIAVTSLAAMAFMEAGSTPTRGPYAAHIDKALEYVLDNTSPSGFVCVANAATHGPMYSHGWGTLLLAETYGMTHREDIREKLEKAVKLIVDSQNREGGWRYQPVPNDADLSVTICQINALRAARNAGIYVPKDTVERCIEYVKRSQNNDGGFKYMLNNGGSAFPRSAAGVVALQSAGMYEGEEIDKAFSYLRQFTPEPGRGGPRFSHYFYGHYYAAQAFWIRGGEDWNEWFLAIRDELLAKQTDSGYWSDTVGNDYGTAMALIILQIPNNYLPIFQR
jgi:prenyltransferase beta subunit